MPPVEPPPASAGSWEDFGINPSEVPGWKAVGFGPFKASMAHGDGFTPTFAVHDGRQLGQMAASWTRVGLGTPEGLRWHRAGFTAKEAKHWRSLGVDVQVAKARRTGYDSDGPDPRRNAHSKHHNKEK